MRIRTLMIATVASAALASFGEAQPTPTGVAVGPWRTGVAVTCPDGRTVPAHTAISGPNVTAADLCGSGSSTTSPSSSGAMISNTGNFAQDTLTNSVNLAIVMRTTNPIVSSFMQGAATGFISSLFANNAEAARQQALMSQEILRRQQEQALQRRIADQQRLDAMFARLSSELKLEGLPFSLSLKGMNSSTPDSLQLKGMNAPGPGDLKLKISDASPTAYGLKGLPGIYVGGPAGGDLNATNEPIAATSGGSGGTNTVSNPNLVSGPGTGTTGPGIPGLPGIYLDGVQPSQAPQLAQAAQTLSGPERDVTQDTALRAAQSNPALTNSSADPAVQNFQQNNQEYQKALAANTVASQEFQTAQAHVDADKSALDVARGQLAAITPSVKQQDAFNQMIAAAKTDEEASMLARQNFDTTELHLSAARDRAATALASLPASAPPSNQTAVVDLSHATHMQPNLLRAPSVPVAPIVSANAAAPVALANAIRANPAPVLASTPTPTPKPTIPQLCAQLNGAQDALRRLMETQEKRNEDRKDWEETVNGASDAALQRGLDLLRDHIGEKISEHIKEMIGEQDKEIEQLYREISSEKDPAKVGAMQQRWQQMDLHKARLEDAFKRARIDQQHLNELVQERDFFKFNKENKGDLVSFMEGIRQVADTLVGEQDIQKKLHIPKAYADYYKYSASIVDSTYDIFSEVLAAQQIKQLNQNSDEFLKAVNALNGRIHQTVAQLNTYKAQNSEGVNCSASSTELPANLYSTMK
jgi:hypothetical protein